MAFSRATRAALTAHRVVLPSEMFVLLARDNSLVKRFEDLMNVLDVFSRNILLWVSCLDSCLKFPRSEPSYLNRIVLALAYQCGPLAER